MKNKIHIFLDSGNPLCGQVNTDYYLSRPTCKKCLKIKAIDQQIAPSSLEVSKKIYTEAANILKNLPPIKEGQRVDVTSCKAILDAVIEFAKRAEKRGQFFIASTYRKAGFVEELRNEMAKVFSPTGEYEKFYFEGPSEIVGYPSKEQLISERQNRINALEYMAKNVYTKAIKNCFIKNPNSYAGNEHDERAN